MKIPITLTVDQDTWRTFRAECIRRGTSASKLIQEFMRMSLEKWGVEAETRSGQQKKT